MLDGKTLLAWEALMTDRLVKDAFTSPDMRSLMLDSDLSLSDYSRVGEYLAARRVRERRTAFATLALPAGVLFLASRYSKAPLTLRNIAGGSPVTTISLIASPLLAGSYGALIEIDKLQELTTHLENHQSVFQAAKKCQTRHTTAQQHRASLQDDPSEHYTQTLNDDPTSTAQPTTVAKTPSRWEQIRAANSKSSAPVSTWDTLRQKHEATRVPRHSEREPSFDSESSSNSKEEFN